MVWVRLITSFLGLLLTLSSHASLHFEISGKLSTQLQVFTQEALYSGQNQNHNQSFTAEPIFHWEWNEGNDSIRFLPFFRVDEHDSERQHGDIRELYWNHVGQDWELRIGVRQEFWGVTEFRHLVDVINQTDTVEDIDGEDKLGQPMINLSLVENWGVLDLYVLPGFRERTFPGLSERLRGPVVVDRSQTRYSSNDWRRDIDLAIRWSHTLGIVDLGLHGFHGSNREPQLQLAEIDTQSVLSPFYEQMNQIGLDTQVTLDSWLWKFETIWRDTESGTYWASQLGFEYIFYGVADSTTDIGVILEYGWDKNAENSSAQSQNTLFLGARFTLNDVDSKEMLLSVDYPGKSLFVQVNRRLHQRWTVSIDGKFFNAKDNHDILYDLRNDDHIQLTVEYFL